MIAKVSRGTGFAGLVAYLLQQGPEGDRVDWMTTRNLPTDRPHLVAGLMRATADESRRVEKPVYHLTLSLDPDEHLSREAFEGVVDRTLRDLGLEEHQALVVAHNDTAHSHVHLMINRVHPETRRAWHAGHDYARIERSLRQQERELGLREVPGRHFALDGRERHRGVGLSSGEQRQRQRTGAPLFREEVREVVRPILRDAETWKDLHAGLAELGLRIEKRGRGITLSDGRQRVKASAIDRKSSLAGLEKRLGPFEPASPELAIDPDRWKQIAELRGVARQLAGHHDQTRERVRAGKAQRERVRLERRVEVASGAFDQRLAQVFREPAGARREILHAVKAQGADRVGRRLASHPETFGKLRGRGGLLGSAERWAARDQAAPAAAALQDLVAARKALALVGRGPESEPKPLAALPVPKLERLARRQVVKLGWTLVGKVLPSPHLQVLRLAVAVGRGAVEVAKDLGKGR